MFNMESRHLLNISVQNAKDCISENFNLKNFPGGACGRNSLEKCAVSSPDGRYRADIATVYYISRAPPSQILRPPLINVVTWKACLISFPRLVHKAPVMQAFSVAEGKAHNKVNNYLGRRKMRNTSYIV